MADGRGVSERNHNHIEIKNFKGSKAKKKSLRFFCGWDWNSMNGFDVSIP